MSFPNHKGRLGLVGGSLPKNNLSKLFLILKGGPGSGNFGHAGIPGHQGGSSPNEYSTYLTKEGATILQTTSSELPFISEKRVPFLYNAITGNMNIAKNKRVQHADFIVESREGASFGKEIQYDNDEILVRGYILPKEGKITYYDSPTILRDYSPPKGIILKVEKTLNKFLSKNFTIDGKVLSKEIE